MRRLRRAGRDRRGRRALRHACRCPSSPRPRSRSPATASRSTTRRRCCGTCWRRSPSRRRSRARATASTAACRARATWCATPTSPTAIERLAADGAAPFYTGDIGAAVSDWVARARRDADARGPRGVRDDPARAGPRPLPRPRGAHQPAAERRRPADRVRARAARTRRRPAGRGRDRGRDGGRAGRAHAGLPRTPRTSRASCETFMALAARLDHPRLGARRRRLGVRGHDHQRRGLGDRRARAPASTSTT